MPFLLVCRFGGSATDNAGVVDDDVEAAEFGFGCRDCLLDACRGGDVGFDCERATTGVADLRRAGVRCGGVTIEYCHRATFGREQARGCLADAYRSTCNDR